MMDPFLPIEGGRFISNRFVLVLAAAARARALYRGAEPRAPAARVSLCGLVLHEIAAGALTPGEIDRLLVASLLPDDDPAPDGSPDHDELHDGGSPGRSPVAMTAGSWLDQL